MQRHVRREETRIPPVPPKLEDTGHTQFNQPLRHCRHMAYTEAPSTTTHHIYMAGYRKAGMVVAGIGMAGMANSSI